MISELAVLPLTPCVMTAGSPHVTDVKGCGEAMESVMLPVTFFSMTSLVVDQGWSGKHIHGEHTDLPLGIGMKFLVRPYGGAVGAVRPPDEH